jgi:glycosyltransferase involved in cell wall biosynthesis
MKILIVIASIAPLYGGTSKIALEWAQELGNQKITVDLVTTNANGHDCLDVPLQSWIEKPSYRIQYFPCWNVADAKLSASLTRWLFAHVKEYDLVHTMAVFSYPVTAAHWACQLHQVPYVMNPQGMLEPWALAYKSRKKQIYTALIERSALEKASAIQSLNSSEQNNIRSLGLKTPLVVIPNGIHRQDFEHLPDPESFFQEFPETRHKTRILFMARIDPKKGLDLLAPAFAKVRMLFPNVHLIVAGPDNVGFLPKVRDYFAAVGCLDGVTFTGMLIGETKAAALTAADIYVAPSYSEGFSMSILEGMVSGLPCVITTGCNFPEAGTAKVAHVVEINADAIANALCHCLQDPEAAKLMGNLARQFVLDNYTWDKIVTDLTCLYQDILKDKKSIATLA